jgi:hypothetical protein
MKGSIRLLLLALLLVFLLTPVSEAQDQCEMTLEKQIGPGKISVVYDGIEYHFYARTLFKLQFNKIDNSYVLLHVKPLADPLELQITYQCSIQWGDFPANILQVGSSGGTFGLGTETGYAEK